MSNKPSPNSKIVWLTNLPAPYRIPIWNAIGKNFDLNVVFTMKEDNYRGWNRPDSPYFNCEYLSKASVRVSNLELVFGIRGLKNIIEPAKVFITGGWESPLSVRGLLLCRKRGIPTMLFYESTLASHRFNGFLVRRFRSQIFSLADLVVTSGSASTKATIEIGVSPEKIVTLFNPVDVQWFSDFANKNRVESSRGHRFLYVGRLINLKNISSLIDAFQEIRQPDDVLSIVGDGPLSSSLKAQAKSLGLERVIRFAGHGDQEQVALEYSRHDTLILPSTNEVWGLVVNEALASGLHVVVSDKAGVAEFVRPMAGVFIAEPTTNQIAKALDRSRAQWVGHLKDHEILSYTPERFAKGIEALIPDLVSKDFLPSLTWLTNIPVPYRTGIWKSLDSKIHFRLITMAQSEQGRFWDLSNEMKEIDHTCVNSKKLSFLTDTPLYFSWVKIVRNIIKNPTNAIYMDGHESPAFFIAGLIAKQKNIKVIIGYRSTLASHRFNGFLVRRFRSQIFSLADLVVTSGSASTKATIEIGVSPEKIVTLFNPVDVQWFSDFANKNRVESSRGHRFLYVGRLINLKNISSLIDAFQEIRQPDDVLSIVGDGPLSSSLKAQAKSLGLERVIRFAGHGDQEQVALEYSRHDTLILPSTNEVWGLVVNEALASGLHVVVSDKAGVAEFVRPMAGVFIAEPTTNQIAKALDRSRAQWVGHLKDHEILSYTPERFANELIFRL